MCAEMEGAEKDSGIRLGGDRYSIRLDAGASAAEDESGTISWGQAWRTPGTSYAKFQSYIEKIHAEKVEMGPEASPCA